MYHQKPAENSTSARCGNPLNWKHCCNRSLNCWPQGQRVVLAQKKRSPTTMVLNRTIAGPHHTPMTGKITRCGQSSMDACCPCGNSNGKLVPLVCQGQSDERHRQTIWSC